MATRNNEDLERLRVEQGQQFLRQMTDMFQQTRVDLAAQFVPRSELAHMNEAVERVAKAVEALTGNVREFRERAPRDFADRAETKQDIAEMRAEVEKLKALYDSDLRRGFDYRVDDMQGRYRGDSYVERSWRGQTQARAEQVNGWLIGGGIAFAGMAVSIILAITR